MNYPMILRTPDVQLPFFTGWFTNHNFQIVRVYHHLKETLPIPFLRWWLTSRRANYQPCLFGMVCINWNPLKKVENLCRNLVAQKKQIHGGAPFTRQQARAFFLFRVAGITFKSLSKNMTVPWMNFGVFCCWCCRGKFWTAIRVSA